MNTTTKFSISAQQKNCRKNIHLTNVTQENMQSNLPFPRKIKIEKKKDKQTQQKYTLQPNSSFSRRDKIPKRAVT